ncbi:right-handed parallel beta-helix repeat-containing protein [Isoptericola sp. BMS4]|uniref:right-handed parallel beta-helix repeat-containing protein n=1 Tax=Isoptericola sp. BMS4 TaxID=2527875 RepID=UPI00196A87CF|nr:right-handed parallel beta-helix repeat-containing protein [Isoptericola sp. BMS4]
MAPDEGARGTACHQRTPCSIERAQELVSALAKGGNRDITVRLAGGTYRLDEPLELRAEDGGRDGRTVTWTAAPGERPVLTGAIQVDDWSVYDEDAGVYVADVPAGIDSRQLYVEGIIAARAAMPVDSSDVEVTPEGLRIVDPALDYLADLPDADRMEFESLGDFTNRYSPVAGIDGDLIVMDQPAWDNNTWGWDTFQNSFLAAPTYFLQNSLAFVDEVGEWYLDPEAGQLYYKPGEGVDPDDLDIELPRLETLMSIGGTYDEPVTGLEIRGLELTGTSWLGPSAYGYANQQNGTFIAEDYEYRPDDAFDSCSRGCEAFERARFDAWYQEPAAVQVSAASRVSLVENRFVNLGSTGLGIGNDDNAHLSGVGLGAGDITVAGNIFNEISGHGIAVGGVRADAHHPSDVAMTNRDIVIENNTINRVAVDYKDNSGILGTYVTNLDIVHNEVANVAYDGIDTGFGWGANDPGGSDEYLRRGYYNWHPVYETPTTLRDNTVSGNLVRNTKARFADGGTLYNLSASPGTVVSENYVTRASGVGLYLDEGTRYTTYERNVLDGSNPWVFTNAYSAGNGTNDNLLRGNWMNSGGAQMPNAEARNNRLEDNVRVDGTDWPAEAQDVICAAGVAPEYRTALNANLFGLDGCTVDAPVGDGSLVTAEGVARSYAAQVGDSLGLAAAGADVWGGGGQMDDEYAGIYRPGGLTDGGSVTVRVDSLNDADPWAKSGVMVRDDISASGESSGYAVLAVTGGHGVALQWDGDGDGYLDQARTADVDTFRPVWVRLTRSGGELSGSYSYDGVNFSAVGGPVTLPSVTPQDAGVFATSHDRGRAAVNIFSELAVD